MCFILICDICRFRFGKPLDALENKENNRVSYENLHMDHIAALIAEGYAQNEVIRALGIARNDLQMARDILHEFVTKRKWNILSVYYQIWN